MTPYIISFIIYFAVLLVIGLVSHKRQRSSADFIVGNRSLNFWVTALSAHASDMSSWLFLAFPAALYIGGMPKIWIALGLLLGMFFNWHFIAKKLRTATEKSDSYTLSTFFERRYGDTSGIIRSLVALITLFFMAIYLSAGLIGMGLLFESLFQIDYYVGIGVASLVVVIYTFSGGFITVAWTDFCQGMFLLLAILIVPVLAYEQAGGWSGIQLAAASKGLSLNLIEDFSVDSFLTILFFAAWGLGYYGQPHIVTKFMGIKNAEELDKSKYLGMSWQLITLGSAAFTGLIALAFFQEPAADPQLIFVDMVKVLFSPLMGGFILCGIVAANMSTMDSQLLVSASVLSEDIYKHLFHKTASPLTLLKASRWAVLVVAALSLTIAFWSKNSSIMQVVDYAWSGLGCAFGPLMIMSLYAESTTRSGAVAGILTGGLVAALWPALNPHVTAIHIPAMIPGFLLSLLAIRLTSMQTYKAASISFSKRL